MVYWGIFITIIAIDFFTKMWSVKELSRLSTIPIFKDVFHLTYVENRGAAFGVFKDGRWFFIAFTIIILAVIFFATVKYKNKSRLLCLAMSFVGGGAAGNLIDRVWRGFVVDMLDFRLIGFPVFNVADIFVCIGAGLLSIYLIFFDENQKKKDCEKNEN